MIIYSIGYDFSEYTGGICSNIHGHPVWYNVKSFTEFKNAVRSEGFLDLIWRWTEARYLTPSGMALWVTIIPDDGDIYFEYVIRMKNVRGYTEYVKRKREEKRSEELEE